MDDLPIIMPAAGALKTPADLVPLEGLGLPELTVGSLTLPALSGNSGDTYHYDPLTGTAWNSIGLLNFGFKIFCNNFVEYIKYAKKSILRISVSPISSGDLKYMIAKLCQLARQYGIRIIIEVNLGCPNVWDTSGQKPLTSYDIQAIRLALEEVEGGRQGHPEIRVAVKFSPILPHMAQPIVVLCQARGVNEIVATNTFPNGTFYNPDTGEPVIRATNQNGDVVATVGGISGSALFPIALANVHWYVNAIQQVGADISVTAVGGINDGTKLWQHRQAGATKFQIGTAFIDTKDPKVFNHILNTLPG